MERFLLLQILSLVNNIRAAMSLAKLGMESSEEFQQVTKSVELTHAAIISASYQTSTRSSIGRLTRSTFFCGLPSWASSERESWVFSCTTLKLRDGDRLIPKVPTFSLSSFTKTKPRISLALNSSRVKMISVFTSTRRT